MGTVRGGRYRCNNPPLNLPEDDRTIMQATMNIRDHDKYFDGKWPTLWNRLAYRGWSKVTPIMEDIVCLASQILQEVPQERSEEIK